MKLEGLSLNQGIERILNTYAQRAQEMAKQRAESGGDTLIEQMLLEIDEIAAELVDSNAEAQAEVVPGEQAAEVELSADMEELQNMQADMSGFQEELENARQQAEAAGEQYENMGKILAIFRRISKGDIVPARDEKKLMEYDSKLYAAAKQLGMMAKNADPKKHKSVDSDEEYEEQMRQKIESMMASVPDAPEISAPAAPAPVEIEM